MQRGLLEQLLPLQLEHAARTVGPALFWSRNMRVGPVLTRVFGESMPSPTPTPPPGLVFLQTDSLCCLLQPASSETAFPGPLNACRVKGCHVVATSVLPGSR